MVQEKTILLERIQSGKQILLAELSPPPTADPAPIRKAARRYVGKVHAVGISDNREGVSMSALAAASLIAAEGVEPILHVVTRDRNRIALVSDYLGARALGIGNVLCTSGTHQTLIRPRAAKNVYDVDSIQLLATYANLSSDARLVGEEKLNGCSPACLGAVASPYADPLPLQVVRVAKKIAAGAQFLVTQSTFDLDRFQAWWAEVTQRGMHQKAAIVAGIRVLGDADSAAAYAAKRPAPMLPDAVVQRIASKADRAAQRAAGIEIAVETIAKLSGLEGLRGFALAGEADAVLEVIEKSGLQAD